MATTPTFGQTPNIPDSNTPFHGNYAEFDQIDFNQIQPHYIVFQQNNWQDTFEVESMSYVGQGSFGNVYKCVAKKQDDTNQKPVEFLLALKLTRKSTYTQVFRQELISLLLLNDLPQVPDIHSDPDDKSLDLQDPFLTITTVEFRFTENGNDTKANAQGIVMEFVKGETLTNIETEFKTKNVDLTEYLHGIAQPITQVMLQARQRGVIHLDLKPDNLMVEADNLGVKGISILDWGVGILDNNGKVEAAYDHRHERMIGTLLYAFPSWIWTVGTDERESVDFYRRSNEWTTLNIIFQEVLGHYPIPVNGTPVTADDAKRKGQPLSELQKRWFMDGASAAATMNIEMFLSALPDIQANSIFAADRTPDQNLAVQAEKEKEILVAMFMLLEKAMNELVDPTIAFSGQALGRDGLPAFYNELSAKYRDVKFNDSTEVMAAVIAEVTAIKERQ